MSYNKTLFDTMLRHADLDDVFIALVIEVNRVYERLENEWAEGDDVRAKKIQGSWEYCILMCRAFKETAENEFFHTVVTEIMSWAFCVFVDFEAVIRRLSSEMMKSILED